MKRIHLIAKYVKKEWSVAIVDWDMDETAAFGYAPTLSKALKDAKEEWKLLRAFRREEV